jgi:hypothetical protein
MSPRVEWTNPRDWTEWRDWQRSKHPKLSFRDQLESGSLFSKNAAVEEALASERQKAREQLLVEKRTKVATELSEQMRRDDLAHRLEQMRAQADFDEVARYFDGLADDEEEAASSSRKPPPPPGGGGARSKQFPEKPDTEAAFEMPIFPDKEDSFAPPEPMFPPKGDSESRNVGRASAFKPKVDISIDSSNIETPPGSRSGSRANSRERARAGAAAVLRGIPKYDDFARDASSAAAAASAIVRSSGKMRSATTATRRPMRPGRNILVT